MPEVRGDLGLPPLPDYLRPGLKILFIGFNPGQRSAATGRHYGYPGNRFWWLLHQSGLTPRLYRPDEDEALPALGYGLTNIVARPSRSSSDLAAWELKEGSGELLAKLHRFRPCIACYNGIGIYRALAGHRKIAYGRQAEPVVPGVADFVAAAPSGRSREPIPVKLELYRELKRLADTLCGPGGGAPTDR
jgi:double-stranded uracil-DNA glycosylase